MAIKSTCTKLDFKKTRKTIASIDNDVEELDLSVLLGGKMMRLMLWKEVWQFLKVLNVELLYDLEVYSFVCT